MKKNALIIAPHQTIDVKPFEQALLQSGISTVRVRNMEEAAHRLANEFFSVLICEDTEDGAVQSELSKILSSRPFGIATPVVLIGNAQQPSAKTLLTSILDQYFTSATDPQLVAEFVKETHDIRREKAKRGRIGPVSVPQLLYRASRFRFSGALVIENEDEKCIIYLEEGNVVFASSNRDENRFGEFLVQQGVITREQFLRAMELLDNSGRRFGRILVDEGFLKPQILSTLVQSQVKHIIFTVFDWEMGEFYIVFGEHSGQGQPVAHFEVGPLVMEGVRFKFDESRLNREFEPYDSVVSLKMPVEDCQKLLRLSRVEIDFLKLVGGGRPIDDLLNVNSFSRIESLRMIYGFQVLEFVQIKRGAVAPPQYTASDQEKQRVVNELFSPKILREPTEPVEEDEITPSFIQTKPGVEGPKFKYWTISAIAGALAFSVVLVVITLFETRTSKKGLSEEFSVFQMGQDRENANETEAEKQGQSQVQAPAQIAEEQEVKPTSVPPKLEPSPIPTSAPRMVVKAEPTVTPLPPQNTPTPAPVVRKKRRARVARVPREAAPNIDVASRLYVAGLEHRKNGQMNSALKALERAHELKPEDEKVALVLADTLFDLDRLAEAEKMYWKVTGMDPRNAKPYLALGTIYVLKNDNDQARRFYERYLNLAASQRSERQRVLEVRKILETLEER